MTHSTALATLTWLLLVLVGAGAGPAAAPQGPASGSQSAPPASTEPRPGAISVDEAIELTNGWALLGQKMPDQAAARAARVLAAYPRSAAAIVLAVEAEVARVGAAGGLAQYERWLGSRTLEEPSIVRRLAVAVLHEAAQDTRNGEARLEALRTLASDGDAAALATLSAAVVDGQVPEMRVMAAAGNQVAIRTLIANLEKGIGNPVASIEALAASGSQLAVAPLAGRLKDPSPEVRAAAVDGLGKLGRQYDVVARIKPLLQDQVSHVRVKAAGALFALGDMSGLQILQSLLTEEAPMSRLVALQAMASQPDAQWQEQARGLTDASEPEIRVLAAKLLLPHDPETARKVLDAAANHGNPAIREMASDAAVDLSATDLRALRNFLKSTSALARVHAGGRILALVR